MFIRRQRKMVGMLDEVRTQLGHFRRGHLAWTMKAHIGSLLNECFLGVDEGRDLVSGRRIRIRRTRLTRFSRIISRMRMMDEGHGTRNGSLPRTHWMIFKSILYHG